MVNALSGIDRLKESVDTLIVIPNDKLLEIVDRRTTMPDALKKADEVLAAGSTGYYRPDQPAGVSSTSTLQMFRPS